MVHRYHYFLGARSIIGSRAAWQRLQQEAPLEAADAREIEIDLALDFDRLDGVLAAARPDAVRVSHRNTPILRIDPVFGAEPIRGVHVRRELLQRAPGLVLGLLLEDRAARSAAAMTAVLRPGRLGHLYDLIHELVLREIRIRYQRSVLGIGWSLLNPLLQLLVFFFVFRWIVPVRVPNFPVFLFIGILVWNWFQACVNGGTSVITDNPMLIRQPAFPTTILPVVTVTSQLVNFLLALPILLGVLLWSGVSLSSWSLLLPLVIALQFVLTLAIVYVTAAVHVSFRDTQYLLGIALLLGFYLSPVFYDASAVPVAFAAIYRLNPMVALLDGYRAVLLRGEAPDFRALGTDRRGVVRAAGPGPPLLRPRQPPFRGGAVVAAAIAVRGLGKRYRRPDRNRTWTLQQAILAGFTTRWRKEYFWSLRDVSFTVERGRMCGVVGRNGAGKSTLLRLLGGVSVPDEGTMTVRGRVGGLLELTAGFHGDLTGRENVMVGGVVRGLRRREVLSRFGAIVEFAELAAVIDHPLRTYSTGMQMRLAFAVAIHCEPDVLLVDEVLAVGDLAFQRKCLEATSRLKAQGVAIVVVSHDLSTVATMCDEAVYLRGGQVVASGAAAGIVKQYQDSVWDETIRLTPPAGRVAAAPPPTDDLVLVGKTRFGSMEAVVEEVRLLWLEPDDRHHDSRLRITLSCHSDHAIEGAIVGLTIVHQDGRVCYDTSSEAAQITVPTLHGRVGLSDRHHRHVSRPRPLSRRRRPLRTGLESRLRLPLAGLPAGRGRASSAIGAGPERGRPSGRSTPSTSPAHALAAGRSHGSRG